MKAIKDLVPGEIFVDSFGFEIMVISIKELPFLGAPRSFPKVKVIFKTQSGKEMFQNFRSNRIVKVKKGSAP